MTVDDANKTPSAAEGRGTQHTEAQKREHDAAQRGGQAVEKRKKDGDKSQEPIDPTVYPEGKTADDYKPENYEAGTDYPEGDPAKGKLDYEKIAEAEQPEQQIAMRDRRAYLLDQAQKNQDANDELNAKQVEQNNRLHVGTAMMQDPDLQRDLSMESAEAEIDMHTPEYVENARKNRAEILDKMAGQEHSAAKDVESRQHATK